MRYNPSNILTSPSLQETIHLYRIQNVNSECYGEVNAIDFCYQFGISGVGEPVFNWTVLIFEETHVFTITEVFSIESHPNSLGPANCLYNDAGGECCDRVLIPGFYYATNSLVFGFVESAQGNTHAATLQGFFMAYRVNTLFIPSTGINISIGSTLPKVSGVPRALRMIWLVFGERYGNARHR